MPARMHLAFNLSYTHMNGRWHLPGSWDERTFPDPTLFEDAARLAERGLLDMLSSGDGTGVPDTWGGRRDGAVTIAGTPAEIADILEERFEATGSRGGFMIGQSIAVMSDLAAVVELLVPELQRPGRFRTAYRGRTLRENLAEA